LFLAEVPTPAERRTTNVFASVADWAAFQQEAMADCVKGRERVSPDFLTQVRSDCGHGGHRTIHTNCARCQWFLGLMEMKLNHSLALLSMSVVTK
jgi:hypothetical protein